MQNSRTSVCVGDIISGGEAFVHGRALTSMYPDTPVIVGYSAPYKEERRWIVGATDQSRAQACFLVIDVNAQRVLAIRLDANKDYPISPFAERIEFTFDNSVDPDRAVKSVELVGYARNAESIAVGDIIKSGRFAEPKILVQKGDTEPTLNDCFVVTECCSGGPALDRKYVKAVQLDRTECGDDCRLGSYDNQSYSCVEFYMSGDSTIEHKLPSVVVIGRVMTTMVQIELLA